MKLKVGDTVYYLFNYMIYKAILKKLNRTTAILTDELLNIDRTIKLSKLVSEKEKIVFVFELWNRSCMYRIERKLHTKYRKTIPEQLKLQDSNRISDLCIIEKLQNKLSINGGMWNWTKLEERKANAKLYGYPGGRWSNSE